MLKVHGRIALVGDKLHNSVVNQYPADIKLMLAEFNKSGFYAKFMGRKKNGLVIVQYGDILDDKAIFERQVKAPDPAFGIQFFRQVISKHAGNKCLHPFAPEYKEECQ